MKKVAVSLKNTHLISTEETANALCSAQAVDGEFDNLADLVAQQQQVIEQKSSVIEEQKKRIAILEEYLRLERARRFGSSSEKHPAQGELFNEAELLDDTGEALAQGHQQLGDGKKKKGRKGLSKDLPRHQIHLNLSEEEKAGAIDTFYTVVKEELDIVPAKARVIEYLQEKAVFIERKQRYIKTAPLPKHPLNKCIASVSLLAFVIVSKYADGLPLYRLEGILKRYGGDITRTSMANWVIRLSVQLQPLINLIKEHQLTYDYLQMDETRIQVLKEKDKQPTSKKWMWVSRGGPPDKPAIVFEYDPSRDKEVPLRLLEDFQGYLQCDGLGSYEAVCERQELIRLGCFDHVRRKFVEAQKASKHRGKKSSGKVSKADVAVSKINALYRLEQEIKTLPPHKKYQMRQKVAIPLLNDLKIWLDKNISKTAKGGLTHKAVQYAQNQWPRLVRYCNDGRLNISNVLAENAIRPFALGRKAWLFADTPKGAQASAIHFSLIETCKANGVDPQRYYREVLTRLPYAETVDQLEALLPWNLKAFF